MIKRYIKEFSQFVNETVHLPESGGYTTRFMYQHMLDGEKDVLYIAISHNPIFDNTEELKIAELCRENGFGEIVVQNRSEGEAWIFYVNTPEAKQKAERLAEIAASHEGYLNDKTPEEAREIGELLDYSESDIQSYVKRRFGDKNETQ